MHYLLRFALCTDFLHKVLLCVLLGCCMIWYWNVFPPFDGVSVAMLSVCAYGIRYMYAYVLLFMRSMFMGLLTQTIIRTANRLVSRQYSNGNDVLPLIFLISLINQVFSSNSPKEISSIGNSNISFS